MWPNSPSEFRFDLVRSPVGSYNGINPETLFQSLVGRPLSLRETASVRMEQTGRWFTSIHRSFFIAQHFKAVPETQLTYILLRMVTLIYFHSFFSYNSSSLLQLIACGMYPSWTLSNTFLIFRKSIFLVVKSLLVPGAYSIMVSMRILSLIPPFKK